MNYYNLTSVRYLIMFVFCLGTMAAQAQVYVMGATTGATTCTGKFTDSGNETGNYLADDAYKITFCSNSADTLYVQFIAFATEADFDILTIYNGADETAPVIGTYSGSNSPGTVRANNPSNCLTFLFEADGSDQRAGWIANIGCGTPPPPPPVPDNKLCSLSDPFCTSTSYVFPATVDAPPAEAGPSYGCLGTQPNPAWYYLQIDQPGNLGISMSNTSDIDVDFVCWGPFTNSNVCNQLTSGKIVDCSFLSATTEHIDINNAVTGQFYILCVTNYDDEPTNFILTTDDTSTATTNCALLCDITAMTAVATGCTGNTHTVTGVLTVQFPPANDTLTLTSSNGYSTTIIDSFGTSVPYTFSGIPTTGGPYTVTARFSSDTSCKFTVSYTLPVLTITPTVQRPSCFGGSNGSISVTSNAAPVQVYTWSNSLPSNDTVTGISAGNYTVTVTGGNGCSVSTTVNVTQPAAVVLGLPVITQSTCVVGGSITASGSGGTGTIRYNWSTGDSTATIINLAAATYTLTVTDANGCTASATYVVPAAPGAITISGSVTDAQCSGSATGEIAVSASGGTGTINYIWSTGDSIQFIDSLVAGVYSVTATDQNNCSAVISYSVGEQSSLTFNPAVVTNAGCTQLGSITVSAAGGSGTFTYTWNNLQTGATIDSLSAGTYTVTATDGGGCSITAAYVVNDVSQTVTISDTTIVPVGCAGAGTGAITVTISGGTAPYTYTWDNSQSGATIDSLTPGLYAVTVTDANGCSTTGVFEVPNGNPLSVSVTATDLICNGTTSGQATANATGGTAPYSYLWSNTPAGTTQTITGLGWGFIQVTVTDANGCSGTGSDVIDQTEGLTFYRQLDPFYCENPAYGNVLIDPRGNVGPVLVDVLTVGSYTVSDAGVDTIAYFTNIPAGDTYYFTLTDSLGCTVSDSFEIKASAAGDLFDIDSTTVSCFGLSDGSIVITPISANGPYTYTFNGGNPGADSTFDGLAAGTYNIVAQNVYGCTVALSGTVTQPAQLTANAQPDTIITAPDQPNVVTVNISNYDSAVYVWTPADNVSCTDCPNPTVTVKQSGAVYVTVSEYRNGACSVTDSVVIIVSGGVKMPNAFSPNNDLHNDTYGPVPMPNTNIVEMRIYNRWGALVHNSNTPWDGTTNGKEQAPGTFIYYITVETPDIDKPGQTKTVMQQGSFTLLR